VTTRAELRARARAELNDLGAVSLWPDELLNGWVVEGIRELGRDLPAERSTSLVSVAGQAGYALPSDVVEVVRVEHPAGYYRLPVAQGSGDVAPGASWQAIGVPAGEGGMALLYDVYGGQLSLVPAPSLSGEAIAVRYWAAYAEPTSDASVLDVPARDEDAVLFNARARALQWLGMDEAKRQRFERSRGASPVGSARQYERQYRDVVRAARDRVRIRRLVRPD
jgi:hypothetical protein